MHKQGKLPKHSYSGKYKQAVLALSPLKVHNSPEQPALTQSLSVLHSTFKLVESFLMLNLSF